MSFYLIDTNEFCEDDEFEEVNFDEFVDENILKKEKIDQNPKIEYDKITIKKYKAFRHRKMDPIAYVEVEEEYAFKFKHTWDPYTGERKNVMDKNGPLYFDPDILINYFYTKMLSKLWVQPSDEAGGFYQGYYDDGAGLGEDFYVSGRGHHPEWYLFRLPIIDCYLTKDHNKQFITFGPKLLDEEIAEIENKANKRPNNFKSLFGLNRPSLTQIKKIYDQAISKTPIIKKLEEESKSKEELQNMYNRANRVAIDKLLQLRCLK